MDIAPVLLVVASGALWVWPKLLLPTERNPSSAANEVEALLPKIAPYYIKNYPGVTVALTIAAVVFVFLVGLVAIRINVATTSAAGGFLLAWFALWDGFVAWRSGMYPVSTRATFRLWTWDAQRSRRIGRNQVVASLALMIVAGAIWWSQTRL